MNKNNYSETQHDISELLERPYWTDYKPFRLLVHHLVTSKYFDLAISAVIGLNVITMAMEYYMMPGVIFPLAELKHKYSIFQYLQLGLKICNYCFTLVFLCEATIKVYVVGPSRYFSDK